MTEQPDEDAEDEIPETSDFVDEEKGKDEFTFETKEINSHSIHDFSNRTPSDTTAVFRLLELNFKNILTSETINGVDVGVLVNNVGISYPYTQYFHELDDERVQQLMTLNVDSTTWMTRLVLPGMVERKRGAIVNIGSAAGVSTSPLLAQYGAAKAYIAMFSKALNVELSKFNIHVQCQVPMFVTTKLAKLKRTSLFVASPSAYARAAVAAIGYETVVSPYWSHALQIWALTTLPEWVVAKLTMSMHLDIRKAGLKKEGKLDGQPVKSKASEKKLT
eukprot:gene18664-18962_t